MAVEDDKAKGGDHENKDGHASGDRSGVVTDEDESVGIKRKENKGRDGNDDKTKGK